jgi:hypothetical protein
VKHAQSVAGEGAIAAAVLSRSLARAAFEEGLGEHGVDTFQAVHDLAYAEVRRDARHAVGLVPRQTSAGGPFYAVRCIGIRDRGF